MAFYHTMHVRRLKGDTCAKRLKKRSKPGCQPASTGFLGDDFIRWSPWRSGDGVTLTLGWHAPAAETRHRVRSGFLPKEKMVKLALVLPAMAIACYLTLQLTV
jgi:hypothetical protein